MQPSTMLGPVFLAEMVISLKKLNPSLNNLIIEIVLFNFDDVIGWFALISRAFPF